MKIGELARKGGVGVETVRYYQRRALLDEPSRAGGVRRYGNDDVRRLRFIRAAQGAGFTLEEIGELLHRAGALLVHLKKGKFKGFAQLAQERPQARLRHIKATFRREKWFRLLPEWATHSQTSKSKA